MAFQALNPSSRQSLSIGAQLAITVFVVCQFVEITFIEIGETPVTLQKLLAVILLPFALRLMKNRISLNFQMILIGISFSIAFSARYIVDGSFPREFWAGNISVLTGCFAGLVLYTALTEELGAVDFLAKIWIWASAATGALACLQASSAFTWLPLSPDTLHHWSMLYYRGIGLKTDSNFQAAVASLGLPFAFFYVSPRWRIPVLLVITLGILATFSRMGLMVSLIALGLSVAVYARKIKETTIPKLLLLFAAVALVFFFWAIGIEKFSNLIVHRFEEIGVTLRVLMEGKSETLILQEDLNSTEIRLILAQKALQLGRKHWIVGVGAFRNVPALFKATGFSDGACNTPLDLFLIGGVFGILAFFLYWLVIFRCYWNTRSSLLPLREKRLLLLLSVTTLYISMFLSLTYISFIWLIPALALAIDHWGMQAKTLREPKPSPEAEIAS